VGFGGMPIYNRAVDSLFGVRTDRLPTETHVSPRIGFTWTLDGGGGHAATFLRGGAGDFHGLTPIGLYAAALGAPGLASAEQQVVCVGAAAPRPNWSLYLQDATTIPSACADTSDAVTSTSRPDVTAFEGRYRAPGARRASLALVRRLGADYWVTIEGGYARGVNQYGLRDRNLSTTPQFTLADEAGRPVYVPLGSIVPATGVAGLRVAHHRGRSQRTRLGHQHSRAPPRLRRHRLRRDDARLRARRHRAAHLRRSVHADRRVRHQRRRRPERSGLRLRSGDRSRHRRGGSDADVARPSAVVHRRLSPLAARPHRRAQLVHRPLATVARPPAQLA